MYGCNRNGVYHAVFHNQIEADDQRLCGGHAYSVDGVDWTFTGTSWGNTVEFERESDPAVVAAHSSGAASYSYSFSRCACHLTLCFFELTVFLNLFL